MSDTTRRTLHHYPTFTAPTAAEAYADAPDLDQEAEVLAQLSRDPELDGCREIALREAALADRRWWRSRTELDGLLAESAAYALQQRDRLNPEDVAGPIGPDSIEWDAPGGTRAYVRQEYLYWYSVPPGCGPCPPEDPCPWHAEHGTR
ncbi:hypothetical protein ACFVXG_45525 [Kitasatospora sp. NPDC058162]|uniref:hypothetical protein n=1 Tax=Kitasatospora sp. NPDC058162 TaxID=3346362 RepID=UPI0036D8E15D